MIAMVGFFPQVKTILIYLNFQLDVYTSFDPEQRCSSPWQLVYWIRVQEDTVEPESNTQALSIAGDLCVWDQ